MSIRNGLRRLQDVGRALSIRRSLEAHDRWSRDRLLGYQRERLARLVSFASERSPFYRDLYGGPMAPADVRLEALPPVDKRTLMASFDRAVTDPRLCRDAVDAHLGAMSGDELYLDEYRIMASSGTSGHRGIYVYDRSAWSTAMAGLMRWMNMMNAGPRIRRRRMAAIGAPDGKHMTYRMGATLDVGLQVIRRLSATEPLDRLVAELNVFQPEAMNAYPSIAAMLAVQQLEGRLRIAPRLVSTSSELRTDEMTARIREAWSVEPFNCLGLTETGIAAADCDAHQGLHVFEDTCVYEVTDDVGRPVPYGEAGAKVLVTNLYNFTLPLIRFEVSDLVRLTNAPCACGRPTIRITSLEGRQDDVLELPARRGGVVRVHPLHLRSPLTRLPAIVEYQIVQHPDDLEVVLVLGAGASAESTATAAEHVLREQLESLGAGDAFVRVRVVDSIEREGSAGKLKLVKRAGSSMFAARDGVSP